MPDTSWHHEWTRLGALPPKELVDARLQFHWAAQVTSGVGKSLLPTPPDYRNQAFRWLPEHGALAQDVISTAQIPFRSALRVADLALLLLAEDGAVLAEMSFDDKTLDESKAWLVGEAGRLVGSGEVEALEEPAEDMPEHAVQGGAPFSAQGDALAELSRYYDNAHRFLTALVAPDPHAGEVLFWPHHIDIASLMNFDPEADPEEAQSIGVGLSPGDGNYPVPYLYVTPWPHDKEPDLPGLPGGGHWHTEGWLGAILTAEAMVEPGEAVAQAQRVEEFVAAAVEASRRINGVAGD